MRESEDIAFARGHDAARTAVAGERADAARALVAHQGEDLAIVGAPDRRRVRKSRTQVVDDRVADGAVEAGGQRRDPAARDVDEQQFGIEPPARIVAVLVTEERDSGAVVRPRRALHRAVAAGERANGLARAVDDMDVGGERAFRQTDRRAERDARPIASPGRSAGVEIAPRHSFARTAAHIEHEDVPPRAVEQSVEIALEGQRADVARTRRRVVKNARRARLVFGRRDERQASAVRRPFQRDDLVVRVADRARFTAGSRHEIDARLIGPLADERKQRAVGRDAREAIVASGGERRARATRIDAPNRGKGRVGRAIGLRAAKVHAAVRRESRIGDRDD